MRAKVSALCAIMVAGLAGCGGGGAESTSEEAATEARTSGAEAPARHQDEPEITGLLGTIPRHEVERTLDPQIPRFMRCFEQRMGQVEVLSGEMSLAFRIRTDGTVAWVYPAASDVGDRQAEQCVLALARGVRFPPPRGGEAEFRWSLGFDAPDDVRPPLPLHEDALGRQRERVASLARECNAHGAYHVTAYIEPGGRVLAAGGSAPSADAEAGLDCILERVRALEMPDPGSYVAKMTFAVR